MSTLSQMLGEFGVRPVIIQPEVVRQLDRVVALRPLIERILCLFGENARLPSGHLNKTLGTNPHDLANTLRVAGIRPLTIRFGRDSVHKGYYRREFERALELISATSRLPTPAPAPPPTPAPPKPEPAEKVTSEDTRYLLLKRYLPEPPRKGLNFSVSPPRMGRRTRSEWAGI